MTEQRIVLTGGTGFLGRGLLTELARRDPAPSVLCLSRSAEAASTTFGAERRALEQRGGRLETRTWQPETSPPEALAALLSGAREIYHLAGEPAVGRRYTDALKTRIMQSRVQSSLRLVEALKSLSDRPRVLVSASGVGYYGPRAPTEPLDDAAEAGSDFLALVCVAWEAAAQAAEKLNVRAVQARLGVVLGPGGGALALMQKPVRYFVGGKLGSGQQMVSWIHLEDAARALIHLASAESLSGPVNVVAPDAVSNAELTRAIGYALGRPTPFWVPASALRLVLGEGAEPLLTGQRALPRRLLETGFSFRYPKIDDALAACL